MIPNRSPLASVALYAIALLLVALALGPAMWLLMVALQPASVDLGAFSTDLTLDNFKGAWRDGALGRALANSVIVTVVRALSNVLIAALAAYPLARMRFRGRTLVFTLILATTMIPEQVIVVPLFGVVAGLGLFDTLLAVVLPFSVTAFGVFLCRQAFLSIPADLEEAARLDGCGSLRVWWHVMLPLSAPMLATLALFSMVGAWSELLWPIIVLDEQRNHTLPVAIDSLMGVFATNTRYAYAGAVLAMLPVLFVFAVLSRWFKPELLAGGVKG